MKRLIIFIVFLAVTAGSYYYYDLSSARFKEEREKLMKKIEEKKKLKEKELQGMVDTSTKAKDEVEEKAKHQKEAIDLLVKERAAGEKAIQDKKKALQDELKSNSEEKREETRKQIEKYTTAITGLKSRLEKVQQAEIAAKEKVVFSYEEKIKAIEAQIDRVDKARQAKEAAILAKSNVPDPEKFMIQRDANRKAAEAVIVKLRAQIDKVKRVMDKAYEDLNQSKHEFFNRDIVIANVRKIEEYENAQRTLKDQLGRMISGRVTDSDPEIAPLRAKQKEGEKKLISMKEEYQKTVGDLSRAKTKSISIDRMFTDQVTAAGKSGDIDELDKEIKKFWNIFFSVCGVAFLALLFMFFKADSYQES